MTRLALSIVPPAGSIQIERGIPLPTDARGGVAKYPFREMQIGESCFIPGRNREGVSGALNYARLKTGFRFVSRCQAGGVRVWRAA